MTVGLVTCWPGEWGVSTPGKGTVCAKVSDAGSKSLRLEPGQKGEATEQSGLGYSSPGASAGGVCDLRAMLIPQIYRYSLRRPRPVM